MAVTAEGVFKIIDKASGPIDKITKAAAAGTKVIDKMAKAMDQIDGPKVTSSIKTTDKNVETLGKTVEKTTVKTTVGTERMGKDFEKMAKKGVASIETVTAALKRFEHERATATIDVNIAKAEAKIRLLKQQLRSLTTAEAQKELGDLGLIADKLTTSLVGSSGGGGPGGGGVRAALGGVSGGMGIMAAAALALAPALVVLTGAVSALVGSLGLAVAGAGALGIGTVGAFVTGLVAIVAIAKPAISQLKELKKAQDAYNKAIQQYGDKSAQAAKAEKAYQSAQRKAPGAASVLNNAQVLGSRFRGSTAPARQDFFGVLNEGLMLANRLLPTFSAVTNRALSAVRGAARDLRLEFSRGEWLTIISTLGDTFARIAGPAARSLGNIALWFGRIAAAVSPMVVRAFESFEKWTGNLANSAANQSAVQRTISGMVDQLKAWIGLIGAATRLAGAFFGAGAQQGGSMVERVTDQLNKWADWINRNPAKMQDFFRRTIDGAGKLVSALGEIGSVLGQIADALVPILSMFSQLVSVAGGSGLLGPLALVGGARMIGGKGLLGGLGGRGAAGAAAAGGVTKGSPLAAGGGLVAGARAAGVGGAVGIGARAVGKAAWPIMAAMAGFDFATQQGTFGERAQHALHGATFGLIGDSRTRVQNRNAGQQDAADFLARTQGSGGNAQVGHLQRMLAATHTVGGAPAGRAGVTPMRVRPVLEGDARERVQAQLDALKPVLHTQAILRSRQAGQSAFQDTMSAFSTRSAAGTATNQSRARKGLVGDLHAELAKLGPEGDRTLLHATATWTATMEHGSKAQRRIATRTREFIKDEYKKLGKDVEIVNGQILDGSTKQWTGIQTALTSRAEKARQEVSRAFTDLQRQAVGALKAMGFTPGEANKIVSGLEKGGTAGAVAQANVNTGGNSRTARNRLNGVNPQAANATGGRLGGVGTADSIQIGNNKVAPGELVVNRHTEAKMDRRLGYPGAAAAMVRGETVPHGMNTNATGGRLDRGIGHPELKAGISSAAGKVLSQYPGLSITSTTGGTHATNSYHYKGEAVDLGGSTSLMNRAAAYIKRTMGRGLTEGIHNPNLSIAGGKVVPSSYWGASTWAGHADHIHLAVANALGARGGFGGGGGAGGQSVRLRAAKSRLGGAPGAASTRGQAIIAGAMSDKINSTIGGSGQGGASDLTSGVSGNNQQMARQMMMKMWGEDQWPALKGLWTGESGFRETARNSSSGAYGIPQALPASKMGPAAQGSGPAAARAQIAWGLRYIKGRYGSPSSAYSTWQGRSPHWYATGGRLPEWGGWHGNGGSFTAHKPTMIGVGEKGAERVKVTPLNSNGTGGARPIHITIGAIHNSEPGDIQKIVERELAAVARNLEHGPHDSEDELG